MNQSELQTYLNPEMLPYPFCPGCGHGTILDNLNEALLALHLDPQKVVIVTDIGCCGLSDRFFLTNAFHGLHGRSVTYGTGIKLANPDLEVVVIMGDGGCGIGGHHLLNAARRNIGLTVLVFNNFNYGMTGGQHSITTPVGGLTSTTPYGQLERPVDVCQTVAINGASFVARATSFDKDLSQLITRAIQNDGFSLIDIWELCTSYFVPNNKFSKKALMDTMEGLDMQAGVMHEVTQPEYSRAYRAAVAKQLGEAVMEPKPLKIKYKSQLRTKLQLVIAGEAGTKIGSAGGAFCRGAVLSGLRATQRHDYPITVKSGHSVGEVILSPEEILFTGISKPDVVLALFPEGLRKVREQIEKLDEEDLLVINAGLLPVDTRARKLMIDFGKAPATLKRKEYWAIMALAELLRHERIYPLEAFQEAVSRPDEVGLKKLAAINASAGLLDPG